MSVQAGNTQAGETLPMVDAMLAVMNELTGIMVDELAMLDRQDVKAIEELKRSKNRLVMNYQANIKSIAAQPELLKGLSDERRAKLRDVGTKLATATERNAVALKAAAMATETLMQNVAGLLRKEVSVKHGYANPRTAHLVLGNHSPTCPPVAVNRTA